MHVVGIIVGIVATLALPGCQDDNSARRRRRAHHQQITTTSPRCTELSYAPQAPIAEASGAHYISATATRPDHLIVIADSGHEGAFLWLDPTTGQVLKRGSLPLDTTASDDLEGITGRDSILYGITSSGYIRHWRWSNTHYALLSPAYPLIGEKNDDRTHTCQEPKDTNCGPNYEGLCLLRAPKQGAPCDGFAVAKASGELVCLGIDTSGTITGVAGRLHVRSGFTAMRADPKTLSGCHFDLQGALWVGTNILGGSNVYRLHGWDSPQTTKLTEIGTLGAGNPEAIVVHDNQVLRFSDSGEAPSASWRYRCPEI